MRKTMWTLAEHRALTRAYQNANTDDFSISFATVAMIVEDYQRELERQKNERDFSPKLTPCCRRHPSACTCPALGLVR